MRLPLEEQRALYERFAARAVDELIELLTSQRTELVDLGAQRAFETVGVHEYGDSTFWKSTDGLLAETLAELADAIFYRQIDIARRAGALSDPAEVDPR